jgi:hypothetical protein
MCEFVNPEKIVISDWAGGQVFVSAEFAASRDHAGYIYTRCVWQLDSTR